VVSEGTVRLRRALRYIYIYVLYASGLLWLARKLAAQRGAIAVLTLHRVLPDEEFLCTSSLPGIVVRERTFSELTEYLRRYCAAIVPDQDPWRQFSTDRPRVALTFDDGWADNAAVAAPIAQRRRIPILVFVCPGLMGHVFPFWPERAVAARRHTNHISAGDLERFVEDLKCMEPAARNEVLSNFRMPTEKDLLKEPLNATFDWNTMAALHASGVSFGSHTFSHPILTQLPPDTVASEVITSKQCIETRLNGRCDMFAYPNGNCSPGVRDAVARAGYHFAFTTQLGLWTRSSDLLRIPRVNISECHLTGPSGRFSRAVFEYTVFWRAGWRT
jgi:peptidoglycan/xylan/chitin deacetylase (PgdA/CDA1 family)